MHKHLTRRILRVAALASAAMLAGCGGDGASDTSGSISGGGGTGTLRVSLTDAPACGYDAVNVTVERVRVHQSATATGGASEAGWSEIVLSPPRKVDLLQLTNGVLFELGQVALPAGNYQQIRLVLADNSSVPLANSVVPSRQGRDPARYAERPAVGHQAAGERRACRPARRWTSSSISTPAARWSSAATAGSTT